MCRPFFPQSEKATDQPSVFYDAVTGLSERKKRFTTENPRKTFFF